MTLDLDLFVSIYLTKLHAQHERDKINPMGPYGFLPDCPPFDKIIQGFVTRGDNSFIIIT
jgi:hypothetical protein